FFSSGKRHTRFKCDWSSDVCSSDLVSVDEVMLMILGPGGASKNINITSSTLTVGDVIDQINSDSTLGVKARINDAGNGILVEKRSEERRVGKQGRSGGDRSGSWRCG